MGRCAIFLVVIVTVESVDFGLSSGDAETAFTSLRPASDRFDPRADREIVCVF